MVAPVILVEATPRRPADAAALTVRLAGGGGERPYFYGGQHWRAGIAGLPKSISKLDFDGEQLGGGGVAQALELSWSPGERGAAAELGALFWRDAPITVRVGPEGAGLPPIVAAGRVIEHALDGGALRIALADQTTDLKRPLLVDRFAGTGGVEGPVEWQGLIKSRNWGRLFNVPGKMIDKANLILCVGDPRRAWEAFDQVRASGAATDPATLTVLGWQGSAEATFTALQTAATIAGGGVLCPSIACVKWWTDPGALHIDGRAENAGGFVETAPEIAGRIVAARSALPFTPGAIAAALAARPAPCGWRVEAENASAAGELSDLLGGVSLSWVITDGAVDFRRWEWTASTRVARSQGVSRRQVLPPVAARKLGYRRNQAPMTRGDLAAIVLARDVAYDDGTTGEAARSALVAAAKAAGDTADAAKTSAKAASDRIAAILADGVLSPNEKSGLIGEFADVQNERPVIFARGNALGLPGATSDPLILYQNAYSALYDYLYALAPSWSDVAQDTPIVPATFRAKWNDYYLARQKLLDAIAAKAATLATWDGVTGLGKDELIRQAGQAATDADKAKTDAGTALTRLTAIQADGVLSVNEKPDLIGKFTDVQNERPVIFARGNALGLPSAATDPLIVFQSSYQALYDYLYGLAPSWSDVAQDTPIVPATFRAKWNDYYLARQKLLDAIAAKAATLATWDGISGGGKALLVQQAADAAKNASDALKAIGVIQSDGWLSAGEKADLVREFAAIQNERPAIFGQGNAFALPAGAADPLIVYQNAYQALYNYLYALQPSWSDTTVDTAVVAATFGAKFTDYYSAKQILLNAIAAKAGTLANWDGVTGTGKDQLIKATADAQKDASAALAKIDVIRSDGWLAAGEKPDLVGRVNAITNENGGIIAQADALSVSRDLYQSKTAAIGAYLNGLTPAWNNTTVDTPIDPAAFGAVFDAYYSTRQVLLNTITAKAATLATWGGTTGLGKPDDNATRNRVTYSTTAPASPADGDIWVDLNGQYAVFKLRSAGVWQVGATALAAYNQLSGAPVKLADINTTESAKLAGVADGAGTTVTLIGLEASLKVTGNSLTQTVAGTYDTFYSLDAFTGPTTVSYRVASADTIILAGLLPFIPPTATDPSGYSPNGLTLHQDGNQPRVYAGGFVATGATDFAAGDLYTITVDDRTASFFRNNQLIYGPVAITPGQTWRFGGQALQGRIYDIKIRPYADVTKLQPVVSKLDPGSGRATGALLFNTNLLLGLPSAVSATATATDQGSGSGVTISIPNHVRAFAGAAGPVAVSYNAGSLTNRGYDTIYFVFADDPATAGGAVTYQSTTNANDLLQPGRYHVTTIQTPIAGGVAIAGSGGSGSGAASRPTYGGARSGAGGPTYAIP